jgi:hypothetical protein
MSNSQSIPWKRISVEAAAIVASILLAFAIDAWWQDRQTRIEEQEVLAGLRAEFLANRELLSRHLADNLKGLQSLEDIVLLIENGQSGDAKSTVFAVLFEMGSPLTTDLGNGTLNALLNSGRVEILASRKLRTMLTAWDGVIGEVWDDQANNAKMVFEMFLPYIVQEGYSRHAMEGDPAAINRLLNDETFRHLVEIRYGYKNHLSGEFETAIATAAEIIAEIEYSLR